MNYELEIMSWGQFRVGVGFGCEKNTGEKLDDFQVVGVNGFERWFG